MDEQEPVAHVYRIEPNGRPCVAWDDASEIKVGAKLYVAPPKREWVGLTDEEINSVCHNRDWTAPWTDTTFARAIEQALKEKNHG